MLPQRLPRRSPWRVLRPHSAAASADTAEAATAPLRRSQQPRARPFVRGFSSSGMDAFMEFEREMAMKRLKENPRPRAVAQLERPIPPKDDECCKLDCPNCVLLVYQEKLLEYELSLQHDSTATLKPEKPEPKYTITFLAAEPTMEQEQQLRRNDQFVYKIRSNELISPPHTTRDGFERSVRHIDLEVAQDQHDQISDEASNIAVFVPNDADIVDRVIANLRVDPDLVFTVTSFPSSSTYESGFVLPRPFGEIGSVRDALTWSLDLTTTPRPSFLRHLAAYATDEDEVRSLMAPNALAALQADRPEQRITVSDLLEIFPSVHLDFASFYQFAPLNAPRYYTVSSSRRLYPDSVSITLGLRKLESQPTPRCSSHLASLQPGADSVRAAFFKSSFVFPHETRKPLMLVSAGTGIAPFRAFLQDLEHEQEKSGERNHREAYLFYGCRRPELDYLYGDDIDRAVSRGYLDALFVDFSDVPGRSKRYVQDSLREQGGLVARHLLEREGYIFVCGSLAMGRAAKRAIVGALLEHSHLFQQEADAKRFLTECFETGRVVTELW